MFGFFFKKNLCDVWDNIFYVVIVNFFSLIALSVTAFAMKVEFFSKIPEIYRYPVLFVTFIAGCILICTIAFAGSENAVAAANFNSPRYGNFFKRILPSFKDGAFSGLFIGLVATVACVSLPFYYRMWRPSDGSNGSPLWLVFMVMIFWFILTTVFAFQWFLPVRAIMKNNYLKCLKKCYIIFFDNMIFTFWVTFVNFLNTLLTLVTFGLYPGMTGVIFTNVNALRICLYKYDWLEVNPGISLEQRKNVPWEDLIAKDRKTLGPRTLKGFIFPWKE